MQDGVTVGKCMAEGHSASRGHVSCALWRHSQPGVQFFFLLLHSLSRQRWGVGKRGPPLDHVTPKGASEGYWYSGVMQGKVLTLGLQTMPGVCCATP